jgi:nitronate monooxygenase
MLDQLAIPIIQAPMLGATTERIAIAVSQTGGLGSFAAAGSSPEALKQGVGAIRAATDAPFLVNTFVLRTGDPDPAMVRAGMDLLAPWRERYGLPAQSVPNQWSEPFGPQFESLVESAPPSASFTFGLLTRAECDALKARGTYVIGTATTVAEAKAWADVGADAICAQGIEAGGHRGTFLADQPSSSIGTFALVRTILAAVNLPVIAAGGITDGAGVAAALALGAAAAQVGTAYLLSDEAIVNPVWRKAIETAPDDPTRLTRVISGKYARGLDNAFMREMLPREQDVPPYPIQNALTQELRAAAVKAGSPDVLSLWAGQAVKLAQRGSAAGITRTLWRDAREVMHAQLQRWG